MQKLRHRDDLGMFQEEKEDHIHFSSLMRAREVVQSERRQREAGSRMC